MSSVATQQTELIALGVAVLMLCLAALPSLLELVQRTLRGARSAAAAHRLPPPPPSPPPARPASAASRSQRSRDSQQSRESDRSLRRSVVFVSPPSSAGLSPMFAAVAHRATRPSAPATACASASDGTRESLRSTDACTAAAATLESAALAALATRRPPLGVRAALERMPSGGDDRASADHDSPLPTPVDVLTPGSAWVAVSPAPHVRVLSSAALDALPPPPPRRALRGPARL